MRVTGEAAFVFLRFSVLRLGVCANIYLEYIIIIFEGKELTWSEVHSSL